MRPLLRQSLETVEAVEDTRNGGSGDLFVEMLTRREHEVLRLLAQGCSAPEVAQQLTLAVSTVKSYIQHVYGKLGVNSKRQAVARGRELGLLSVPAPRPPVGRPAGAAEVVSWEPAPRSAGGGASEWQFMAGLEALMAHLPPGQMVVVVVVVVRGT